MSAPNNYRQQRDLCARYGVAFVEAPADLMVGLAHQTLGRRPIYGLRHSPEGVGTGWFLWMGEADFPQEDADYFQPTHVLCLAEHCPEVLPYLGLPPGTGFVIDPARNYIDVWQDPALLEVA